MVQIPKLDMSVAHCDKIGAVLRKRHTCHLTGHLVGSHNHIFLQDSTIHIQTTTLGRKNCSISLQNVVAQNEATFQAQTLTIMSCWFPTLTMYLPLGEKATHETPYLCVWSSATCLRSATSHTLTAGRWPLWWTGQGQDMGSIMWGDCWIQIFLFCRLGRAHIIRSRGSKVRGICVIANSNRADQPLKGHCGSLRDGLENVGCGST